jgi:hypothetical protein
MKSQEAAPDSRQEAALIKKQLMPTIVLLGSPTSQNSACPKANNGERCVMLRYASPLRCG